MGNKNTTSATTTGQRITERKETRVAKRAEAHGIPETDIRVTAHDAIYDMSNIYHRIRNWVKTVHNAEQAVIHNADRDKINRRLGNTIGRRGGVGGSLSIKHKDRGWLKFLKVT